MINPIYVIYTLYILQNYLSPKVITVNPYKTNSIINSDS